MSIRKKIIISNLLMIIVPLFLLLIMGLLWLNTAGRRYWQPIEEMYEDKNGVISAQNLIYAYQEELWDTNWAQLESLDEKIQKDGKLHQTPEMIRLRQGLTDLGYRFTVLLNDEALYSNITEQEWNQVEALIGPVPEQANSITVGNDNISVIKCTFHEDGDECAVIAVSSNAGILGSPSYLQRYVIPYIWILVIGTVCIVIFVNACCSKWISSLIIPPMKEIRRGMQKVREGRLDGEIRVYRNDELGEVSGEFNEMQRQLKKSREEQMKYETYRKELIFSISHDLRTPLTTIKGYVGGILDGIADTEEKRRKYLLAVQTRAGDLENLVNQLSSYNKMENHVFQYTMEEMDLKEFVAEYLAENEKFADENRLQIRLKADKGNYLKMDKGAFKRIMDNLLTNCVRYREKESSSIQITIERKRDRIIWKVGDDGPGVPKEDLEKIFESFCRLDAARSHCGDGSGLGLAIVKRMVLDHQGTVYARNKGGLEICMEFPAIKNIPVTDGYFGKGGTQNG
ncbi:MAG: sensor histidine kinase [Ruminococcus sp.]|jgi:signal transduction histidine kinase